MSDLDRLSKDELIELIRITAKDLIALDGTWFQSLENRRGMDTAMDHDIEAWQNFVPREAKRIKSFLGLGDDAGIDGLAAALPLHCVSLANSWEMDRTSEDELVFRVTQCRVQSARTRKGMELHPCKPAGCAEYGGFASAIDERIECECLSCYPDLTDETCSCAWRFSLRRRHAQP